MCLRILILWIKFIFILIWSFIRFCIRKWRIWRGIRKIGIMTIIKIIILHTHFRSIRI